MTRYIWKYSIPRTEENEATKEEREEKKNLSGQNHQQPRKKRDNESMCYQSLREDRNGKED